MKNSSVYVVLLAAGRGTRLMQEQNVPKQFLKLKSRYLFQYAFDVFHQHDKIDGIYMVVSKEYEEFTNHFFSCVNVSSEKGNYNKLKGVLIGGSNRTESMLSVLDSLEHLEDSTKILFHDVVRPFISENIISSLVEALEMSFVCTVATPFIDSLAKVLEHHVLEVPDRNDYMTIQTPQGLHLFVLRELYQKWKQMPFFATDLCQLLRHYVQDKYFIEIILGEKQNFKITYRDDWLRAINMVSTM